MSRYIIHLDLDAFFIAVECKRNPKLRGLPLIVGGHSGRGVVASCSYEARYYGIHSAMPVYLALQRCPQAHVLPGDMESYSRESRLVTEIIANHSPLFEKSSIDEFYIDASRLDKYFDVFQWAIDLQKRIYKESQLPISMTMSSNKLISKVATGEFKPVAQKFIPIGEEKNFLSPLAIEKLPMVGSHTTSRLHAMGVQTIADLQLIPLAILQKMFGKNGYLIWQKANGIDDSPLIPFREQKSISTESTFSQNTVDVTWLKSILITMVEKVMFQLRRQKKMTACVIIKIRYSNFDTPTHQTHIAYTASDHVVFQAALGLFDKLYIAGEPVRLIGIRLSDLVFGHTQVSLFENTSSMFHLYKAIDYIKNKHGEKKIVRATTLSITDRQKQALLTSNS